MSFKSQTKPVGGSPSWHHRKTMNSPPPTNTSNLQLPNGIIHAEKELTTS